MQKNQNQTCTLARNIAPDYFAFDLYINMISTLNIPVTNIHIVSRGLHVRENKILLDFFIQPKVYKF